MQGNATLEMAVYPSKLQRLPTAAHHGSRMFHHPQDAAECQGQGINMGPELLTPPAHQAGHLGPHSASLARGSLPPEKQCTKWPRFASQARSTPSTLLQA